MTNELATTDQAAMLERLVVDGDLSKLTPDQKFRHYIATCDSLGLNWRTKPFAYLRLNGKEVLYAQRDCTDQLRKTNAVSIVSLERERMDDLYVVTATARTPDGRTDSAIGAVPIGKLQGEPLANAIMKCETKAKRRVTLSICGLGMTDESEVSSIPDARVVQPEALPETVDHETGEITGGKSKLRMDKEKGYALMHAKYHDILDIPPLNPDWTDEELDGTGSHWKHKIIQYTKDVPADAVPA